MEKSGMVGTQVGGVIAVVGGLGLNEKLAIGGFLLALVSLVFQMIVTIYFKLRHLRLAEARLAADLADKGDEDES